jgi:hypothetical protein
MRMAGGIALRPDGAGAGESGREQQRAAGEEGERDCFISCQTPR